MTATRVLRRIARQTVSHYREVVLALVIVGVLAAYALHPIRSLDDLKRLMGDEPPPVDSACSDVMMAMFADHSEQTLDAAYDCLATPNGTREAFIASIKQQKTRSAPYRVASDGNLVFYADGKGTGWI